MGVGGGFRIPGGALGTECTVGRRVGSLGGRPEGLGIDGAVRGGVVLLSDESDIVESRFAPVFTPPFVLLRVGIPPANKPAS